MGFHGSQSSPHSLSNHSDLHTAATSPSPVRKFTSFCMSLPSLVPARSQSLPQRTCWTPRTLCSRSRLGSCILANRIGLVEALPRRERSQRSQRIRDAVADSESSRVRRLIKWNGGGKVGDARLELKHMGRGSVVRFPFSSKLYSDQVGSFSQGHFWFLGNEYGTPSLPRG